jgi:hypothetical protein
LYEAGPNYIVIEYVRGESLKEHLKRSSRISSALARQILSVIPELKRIGFTWTNFAIRHFIMTRKGQLKVIDLKNAYDRQLEDVPYMLLRSLSRMGLRDRFLRQVDKLDPLLGSRWRRADLENSRRMTVSDLAADPHNGKECRGQTFAPEFGFRPHAG